MDPHQKEQFPYLDDQDPYEFTALRVSEKKIYLIFAVTGTMLSSRVSTYLSVLPIFLVSLSIHEYAHAWVAYRYGDDTAKRMGRLTLNPLAHISLLGTIILPLLVHFGWAKPVPVNFSILTKSQIFKVAAAGPSANMLLALILTGAFHVLGLGAIPLLANLVLLAILFNIILAIFNLIPIPPLDGSKMVYARLKSPEAIDTYRNFSRFGMLILIGFLLLGGFQIIILPLAAVFYALLGLPLPALTIKHTKITSEELKPIFEKQRKEEVMMELGEGSFRSQSTGLNSLATQRGDLRGGTLVNIVAAVIFLGLLGLGLWWVIKSIGEAGQQYSEVLIDTQSRAVTVRCQTNLRAIWQNLQTYAISNESFPPSSQALVEWSGNTQLFQCPAADGQEYVYIPGQREGMSGENVLVYERQAVHDGRCSVLRLNGQIELLTPEQVEVAVARTLASLR